MLQILYLLLNWKCFPVCLGVTLTTTHLFLYYILIYIHVYSNQEEKHNHQRVIFISSVSNRKSPLTVALSLGNIDITPSIIQSTNFINFFFLIYLDYINYIIPFLNELSISKQIYLFLLIEWFTFDFSSPPYRDYVNSFESFKVFLWVFILLHPNILLLLISYSRTSMIFIEWFCLLWLSFTFELYIFLAFFSTTALVT